MRESLKMFSVSKLYAFINNGEMSRHTNEDLTAHRSGNADLYGGKLKKFVDISYCIRRRESGKSDYATPRRRHRRRRRRRRRRVMRRLIRSITWPRSALNNTISARTHARLPSV